MIRSQSLKRSVLILLIEPLTTNMQTLLVTGGAGFIGSCFVRTTIAGAPGTPGRETKVVNFDALTYAGNLDSLEPVCGNPDHVFVQGDIIDRPAVDRAFAEHRPTAVVHFAAESHVDRSIDNPSQFVVTNVLGTFQMLDAALRIGRSWPSRRKANSASCMFPPTRFMARWGPPGCSLKERLTIPARPIRPRKPRPTILCGRTTAPTACRCW